MPELFCLQPIRAWSALHWLLRYHANPWPNGMEQNKAFAQTGIFIFSEIRR
jgi:hypothetical protein